MKFNILFFVFTTIAIYLIPGHVQAQESIGLEAGVGRYYFSASGIVSPYSSVVMTSQDYFLSSSVADSEGKFMLPEVLVNDGFDNFCLEAVDIRRLGTSYTCFNTEPPTSDFSLEGIFLPPTVGLSGRKIEPNSSITASGYSMPNSTVDVRLGEDFWVEAEADENGYYETELKSGLPPGKYELYATAVYGAQVSEKPTKTFTIEVISLFSKIPVWLIAASIIVLILIFIFIPLIILVVRRRRGGAGKKPRKKTAATNKPSFTQKLLFWRA